MTPAVLNRFRGLIAKDQLETVISQMLTQLADHPRLKELILLSQSYHSLAEKIRQGLLTQEQISVHQKRLSYGLLEFINLLEKEYLTSKSSAQLQSNGIRESLEALWECLDMSYEGFQVQSRIRNKLVPAVRTRLSLTDRLQYESFFSTYFTQMDEDELRLHASIRGYTQNLLSVYNRQALALLQSDRSLRKALPRLKELEKHLIIWMAKFEGAFQTSPSMCLVYVGVEEGVPFPFGIENEIEVYLESLPE